MIAQIRGYETLLRIMPQPTPGTLPAGNWQTAHFYNESFEPGQDLEKDPELGGQRHNPVDPGDPVAGLDSPSGSLSVPLDINQIGHYLKSLFGAAITTGTAPNYTHTFTSGKEVLSAMAAEISNGADLFKIAEFFVASQAAFPLAVEGGYRQVDLSTIIRRVYEESASVAGAPVAAPARAKVPGKTGLVRINGTQFANVLGGDVTYANGAAGERYSDDTGLFGSIDPGDPTFTANPQIRARKSVWAGVSSLFDGRTPFAFEAEYRLAPETMMTITAPRCFGKIVIPAFDGPGGTSVTPEIMGAQSAAEPMVTIVLKNQVAAY